MNSEQAFDETQDLVSLEDQRGVLKVLQDLQVCGSDESILAIEKAGEGNMNLVMRVVTESRSVIVKQARPWVEKYPTIAAPIDRVLAEIDFYQRIRLHQRLAEVTPEVIAVSTELRLFVMQDLGKSADFTFLYEGEESSEQRDKVFEKAIAWLRILHSCVVENGGQVGCQSLRELNCEHMFSIPFAEPPSISLDSVCPGLELGSLELREDVVLAEISSQLAKTYLEPNSQNSVLLHGDYYPGSWLSTSAGFRVIDPEFCFYGPAEFDLGVLAAHLILCHGAADRNTIDWVIESYGRNAEEPLVQAFAGIELIRRLIGVAQLPLNASLTTRLEWLRLGKSLLKGYAV